MPLDPFNCVLHKWERRQSRCRSHKQSASRWRWFRGRTREDLSCCIAPFGSPIDSSTETYPFYFSLVDGLFVTLIVHSLNRWERLTRYESSLNSIELNWYVSLCHRGQTIASRWWNCVKCQVRLCSFYSSIVCFVIGYASLQDPGLGGSSSTAAFLQYRSFWPCRDIVELSSVNSLDIRAVFVSHVPVGTWWSLLEYLIRIKLVIHRPWFTWKISASPDGQAGQDQWSQLQEDVVVVPRSLTFRGLWHR